MICQEHERTRAYGLSIALTLADEDLAMDPLTSAAASGIRARLESLDMLANNIANASAPGFKADHEFYGLYLSAEAAHSPDGTTPVVLPVIERQWIDFTQGSLTPTANPLDLALSGQGFFVAQSPGGPLFTRAGSFRISPQGQLETQEGFQVQGQDGKPILLDNARAVEVSPDGSVRQDGEDVGKIAVVNFQDPSALEKRGKNYFRTDLASMPPLPATQTEIRQGKLEAANAQPAESAVRLVNVLRQFETLQKAMAIGADMNRRAVEEVARVTQ
jgi:flagellar basal-body rod protein FlgF